MTDSAFKKTPLEHLQAAEEILLKIAPAIAHETTNVSSKSNYARALVALAEGMLANSEVDMDPGADLRRWYSRRVQF